MPENFLFVALAYGAIWVVLIIYLASMGSRLGKMEKQVDLLKDKK